MTCIEFHPIGIISTPYQKAEDMPIQPGGAAETAGVITIDEAYAEGLADIEGFSHIILIYLFHRSRGFELRIKPFLDDQMHGLFATRAPRRPNPVGLSVVPLVRRDANILHVRNIDVLDGTPLIDLKPYVPSFDTPQVTATGWLEGKQGVEKTLRSDDRFSRPR
jgi:tRNA-Thr(GGU) m(6)t(6)A37 methyltransferase TsaA